jgi:replicative DNA helicase
VERQLISRVVARPEDLPAILRQNVQAKHFHDDELAEVWQFIVDHYSEYGQGPDSEAVRLEFGDFRFNKPANPTQYYVDKLLDDHRLVRTKEVLAEGLSAIKGTRDEPGDHEEALALLHAGLVSIEQETSLTDDTDTSDWSEAFARYREIEEKGDAMTGIATGFPFIDMATGGWQAEQLVIVAGPQKAGKSSALVKMAQAAQAAGYKVLFFSFEMSNQEQIDRYISLMAGVSKWNMKHGKLTKAEWHRLEAIRATSEQMVPITWVHDVRRTTTIAGIEAKIDQHSPDIVFIDGVYMMDAGVKGKTGRDWEALAVLTAGLKRMAQNLKLPVVGSTQALESKFSKKDGLQTKAIGYSATFGQDADVLIGFEKADDNKRARMKIMDARDAGQGTSYIVFDWDTGTIEEDAEYEEDDDDGFDD